MINSIFYAIPNICLYFCIFSQAATVSSCISEFRNIIQFLLKTPSQKFKMFDDETKKYGKLNRFIFIFPTNSDWIVP